MDWYTKSFVKGSFIIAISLVIGVVFNIPEVMILLAISGFMSIPLFLLIEERKLNKKVKEHT